MNKEYLNVILVDSNEGNRFFFKKIFKDLKIGIKILTFENGEELMNYLNCQQVLIPEILFMEKDIPKKSSLDCLEEIKSVIRFDQMVITIYSKYLSPDEEENIFVKGANIIMEKPDNYVDLKKVLSEIITINWQYHTSGLNKNNFIMKV